MTSEDSRAREIMQYSFLVMFANDGTIDANELAFLERLALRDTIVDDDERAMLANIFARVSPDALTPSVRDEIDRFKRAYGIA